MITYKLFDKVSEKAGSQTKLKSQNANLWEFLVRPAGLEPTPQASETCTLSS